jgi:hypothetical protein
MLRLDSRFLILKPNSDGALKVLLQVLQESLLFRQH